MTCTNTSNVENGFVRLSCCEHGSGHVWQCVANTWEQKDHCCVRHGAITPEGCGGPAGPPRRRSVAPPPHGHHAAVKGGAAKGHAAGGHRAPPPPLNGSKVHLLLVIVVWRRARGGPVGSLAGQRGSGSGAGHRSDEPTTAGECLHLTDARVGRSREHASRPALYRAGASRPAPPDQGSSPPRPDPPTQFDIHAA